LRKIHWSIAKRFFRLFSHRFRVVRRLGGLFLLDNKNWIDTRLLIGQPYEREQIATAIELIKENEIDLFIDVGSNIGVYSIILALNIEELETISFEPVVRNYNQLCANIFLNNLNRRVVPVNKALSDENAEVKIQIDPKSTGVSSITVDEQNITRESFSEIEKIQCVQFDEEHSFTRRNMFIKIDVEGHEPQSIAGMQKTLQNNNVILQVEVLSDERNEEITKLLDSLGYRFMCQIGDDCRFTNI
jgi:FkbM family methyltransferase